MLIAMAVYDTEDNNRSWMTRATLNSLARTVDWTKHRLVIIDNASYMQTQRYIREASAFLPFTLIRNERNLGTAAAINQGWREREPGEHCVKMDNDVTIAQAGWADWIEDVFTRAPGVGICGLKRNDLAESPRAEGSMKSTLTMLPHERGQRWITVEEVRGVMGTCQGFNSALLDKIGYLYQMQDEGNLYGYDDSLASVRSRLAGFKNVFLCNLEIEHLDPGGDSYCQEKRDTAGKWMTRFQQVANEYKLGVRELYYAEH